MSIKALVFDDDAEALNLIQMFLGANDIEVSGHLNPTCPTYQLGAATCQLDKPKFNLIISDNNMPKINGIDFYEDIHSKGCKLSNRCKALLSGQITPEVTERAKALGIKIFEKPCSFKVLGEWVDQALKRCA